MTVDQARALAEVAIRHPDGTLTEDAVLWHTNDINGTVLAIDTDGCVYKLGERVPSNDEFSSVMEAYNIKLVDHVVRTVEGVTTSLLQDAPAGSRR